jgi:hypothetical protein
VKHREEARGVANAKMSSVPPRPKTAKGTVFAARMSDHGRIEHHGEQNRRACPTRGDRKTLPSANASMYRR